MKLSTLLCSSSILLSCVFMVGGAYADNSAGNTSTYPNQASSDNHQKNWSRFKNHRNLDENGNVPKGHDQLRREKWGALTIEEKARLWDKHVERKEERRERWEHMSPEQRAKLRERREQRGENRRGDRDESAARPNGQALWNKLSDDQKAALQNRRHRNNGDEQTQYNMVPNHNYLNSPDNFRGGPRVR